MAKSEFFITNSSRPATFFLTSSMAVEKIEKGNCKKRKTRNFTAGQNEKCHQQVYKVFLQLLLLLFTSSKLSLTLNFSLSSSYGNRFLICLEGNFIPFRIIEEKN